MKKMIFILLITSAILSRAQEYSAELVFEMPLKADFFIGVDDYNALYYAKDNQIIKQWDDITMQFSALQLGKITSIDILNPLKIIVFYDNSNTVVILDNTLSEIERINFSTIPAYRNISHASNAGDRKLWIFNTDEQRLEIYDWGLRKITTQFPPRKSNETLVVSNFNFAWVADDNSLSEYNIYGSFLDENHLKNIEFMSQSHGNLLLSANTIFQYKKKNAREFLKINLPELPLEQLYLNNEILYIYSHQKVKAFRIKLAK
ncbi:hypothetical protein [Dokdonia sp. Hel_I_53]|uniref:hypothetical protein n=1 Tax=Dokdonia sp. Hel_I_53 TaxID=1566287 RepID=UPI00119B004C|nr:hypothetical protein [Dokdonia sp. Hel_I_53]TVZ52990.1 hypothetical protein OD90_2180 [Dokdonia sp. Hel_I_53]